MQRRKRVACISGGGARIFLLHEMVKRFSRGYYDHVVGCSSGAILAVGYACAGYHGAEAILHSIKGDGDVYRGGGGLDKVLTALDKRPGFVDPSPVWGKIEELLKSYSTTKFSGFSVGVAGLGLARSSILTVPMGTRVDVELTMQFVKGSSSVAPFFPIANVNGNPCVDWGVIDFAPIGTAMRMIEPDETGEIDVFLSKPLRLTPEPGGLKDWSPMRGALRQIEMLSHQVLVSDLTEAALRNRMAGSLLGVPGDRMIEANVFAPTEYSWFHEMPPLRDYLDFNPGHRPGMRLVANHARRYSLEEARVFARQGE